MKNFIIQRFFIFIILNKLLNSIQKKHLEKHWVGAKLAEEKRVVAVDAGEQTETAVARGEVILPLGQVFRAGRTPNGPFAGGLDRRLPAEMGHQKIPGKKI